MVKLINSDNKVSVGRFSIKAGKIHDIEADVIEQANHDETYFQHI